MNFTVIFNICIILENLVNTKLLVFVVCKDKDIPASVLKLCKLLLHKVDVSKETAGWFC